MSHQGGPQTTATILSEAGSLKVPWIIRVGYKPQVRSGTEVLWTIKVSYRPQTTMSDEARVGSSVVRQSGPRTLANITVMLEVEAVRSNKLG